METTPLHPVSPHASPTLTSRLRAWRQRFSDRQQKLTLRWRMVAVFAAGVVAFGAIFQLGMFVGMERSDFADNWQQGYLQSIASNTNEPGMFEDDGAVRTMRTSNGVVGQIIYMNGSLWTVRDLDAFEKVVRVVPHTIIMKDNFHLSVADVHVDDPVVVLGTPNRLAQLEARLIRVLPFIPHMNR